jgi:hypothetical protein
MKPISAFKLAFLILLLGFISPKKFKTVEGDKLEISSLFGSPVLRKSLLDNHYITSLKIGDPKEQKDEGNYEITFSLQAISIKHKDSSKESYIFDKSQMVALFNHFNSKFNLKMFPEFRIFISSENDKQKDANNSAFEEQKELLDQYTEDKWLLNKKINSFVEGLDDVDEVEEYVDNEGFMKAVIKLMFEKIYYMTEGKGVKDKVLLKKLKGLCEVSELRGLIDFYEIHDEDVKDVLYVQIVDELERIFENGVGINLKDVIEKRNNVEIEEIDDE